MKMGLWLTGRGREGAPRLHDSCFSGRLPNQREFALPSTLSLAILFLGISFSILHVTPWPFCSCNHGHQAAWHAMGLTPLSGGLGRMRLSWSRDVSSGAATVTFWGQFPGLILRFKGQNAP